MVIEKDHFFQRVKMRSSVITHEPVSTSENVVGEKGDNPSFKIESICRQKNKCG